MRHTIYGAVTVNKMEC